jgi:hypothetical protein
MMGCESFAAAQDDIPERVRSIPFSALQTIKRDECG